MVAGKMQAMRRYGLTRPAISCVATTLLAIAAPQLAIAQSAGANATRRELIEQASTARAAGNHQQAIDLAQRASQIRMSVSLRMFLAEEQAAIGQLTAALDNADTCTREVRTEAGVTDRDSVASHCRGLVDSLTHRVARVVVHVAGNAQGVDVHVAGDPLAPALWNVAYVVNPGAVVVDAVSPQGAFHRVFQLAEGQTENVEVSFDHADEQPAPVATPVASSAPTPVPAPVAPHDDRPSVLVRSPIGSYVTMGVGGATLVTSVVFWVLRAQAFSGCSWNSSALGYCDTAAEVQRATTAGQTFNVAAPVTLAVGAVVAAGGLAWWLLVRRHQREESASHTSAWIAPDAHGLAVGFGATF